MDFLRAEALPWLGRWRRQLGDLRSASRLPHSILLLSMPGLGAEHLADWLVALALCEHPDAAAAERTAPHGTTLDSAAADGARHGRPCGTCAACVLLRADSHPDYHPVRLEDDAKQIKVEHVRDLIDSLTLKSYRGGWKVGVIEGAEALNTHGANAFLKTLEEPSADTLLLMIARPAHRLPATIASRCLRMVLRAPGAPVALPWLAANGPPERNWTAALELAGGAPLRAIELQQTGIAALETDMQEGIRALSAGAVDVTLLADQWVRSNLPLRIAWLENWITHRVRGFLAGGDSGQSAGRVSLPAALLKPKIRALFELLDATRELRRLAATGMNQQLALEALLLGGRTALAR